MPCTRLNTSILNDYVNILIIMWLYLYVFLSLIQQVLGYPQPCWQTERGVQNHSFKWAHQLIYNPVISVNKAACFFILQPCIAPFWSIVSIQAWWMLELTYYLMYILIKLVDQTPIIRIKDQSVFVSYIFTYIVHSFGEGITTFENYT